MNSGTKAPHETVQSRPRPLDFCTECDQVHLEHNVCSCGACMYKNSKQVPDPMYPVVECIKCGRRHFWD